MKNSKTGKYVVLGPAFVNKSMKSCFEQGGGGIKQLMEEWGDAELLYGMIPSDEKESGKK